MEGQITIGLPYKASCTLSDSMVRQEAGLSTAGAESQAIPLTALKMTICFLDSQDDILLWMTMAKG